MTIFVDASAMVAIVAREPERDALIGRLTTDTDRIWSPMAVWETVSALRRSHRMDLEIARFEAEHGAAALELRLVAIGETELRHALDAYRRYGKGQDAAGLNFGDCFAYACAKTNEARLLYKGNDFARTDLAL